MKDLLQGKPFGHPLHPILVHFPIGLFVFGFVLDLAAFVADDANPFLRSAFYAIVGGVAMALFAAVPGLVDWAEIRTDHPAKKTATTHMLLNLAAVALYAVNLALRAGDQDADEPLIGPFLLSLVGIGLISVSGYLGGTLVYGDGIGVGRHRRRTALPHQTIHFPDARDADGFVSVAAADSLSEGETLRVEVDGTVLVVARIDGRYAAFQEFCTHRYGPLSEGPIYDGQVECPWHRSRFDVFTGKVTQGPAKVDLKTFDVAVRDGMIRVRTREARADGPLAAS